MKIKYKLDTFKRKIKYAWQRAIHGYDYCDVYNLNDAFIDRYIKILTAFKEENMSVPIDMTEKEWDKIIDEMINYLKSIQSEEKITWEIRERYKDKFFELFSKYFFDLWS